MKDNIYSDQAVEAGSFQFDSKVAEVFDDMIQRSVPGYIQTLEMIGVVAQKVLGGHPGNTYDLGCSLGASMYPVLANTNADVCGVDLSSDMLKIADQRLAPEFGGRYTLIEQNLLEFEFNQEASLVISNFTLQFLPVESRMKILRRCYDALTPGGALLVSEKIHFSQDEVNNLMISLHHTFKSAQGYSDLEIARKRDAIEQVLIPESGDTHLQRLRDVGFQNPSCWYQCFNFASFIAIK